SYRFQWPSDLLTSWAFEMEILILGWFILVETQSVILLTMFGSLQFLGTLVSPIFGVMGDRFGRRTMLCAMRAFYAFLAFTLMVLGLTDSLTPVLVFVIALLTGMVRPSDTALRNALIGDTITGDRLVSALSLSRTTMDTARIAGALAGGVLFQAIGIGNSYIIVSCFYIASFFFTLGVSKVNFPNQTVQPAETVAPVIRNSGLRDLKDGMLYVWNTPNVLAMMYLAFLANMTAFPVSHGLLPFIAKDIYQIDSVGLGHLAAAFSMGALASSIVLAATGGPKNPARFMVITLVCWYVALIIFAFFETKYAGFLMLILVGVFHGASMTTMSVAMLNTVTDQFRARVMGVRMLAVYGLPIGLLASGFLIASFGFLGTVLTYCCVGIVLTVLIAYRWRDSIWR
ncbi:MAG: MFS transporter, partial [Proteobacteria bacterium]|nr:MFS transporter [Pseudomonadota bacterium]